MVADGIQIETSSVDALDRRIKELLGKVKDLRPLFEQFSADFYKDEKRIFKLKSEGQYEDLNDEYAERKEQKYGFRYPILFATGRLARSLLSRNASESVNIIDKRYLLLGTSVPYGIYHHSEQPRKKLPRRPLWFLDPENNTALGIRWGRTLDAYWQKALDGTFR